MLPTVYSSFVVLNVFNSDLRTNTNTNSQILVNLLWLTLLGKADFFFQIIVSAIVKLVLAIIGFVIGFALAYAFYPFVRALKERKIPKTLSVIFLLVILLLFIVFLVFSVLPLLTSQLTSLAKNYINS